MDALNVLEALHAEWLTAEVARQTAEGPPAGVLMAPQREAVDEATQARANALVAAVMG